MNATTAQPIIFNFSGLTNYESVTWTVRTMLKSFIEVGHDLCDLRVLLIAGKSVLADEGRGKDSIDYVDRIIDMITLKVGY